MTRVNDSDPILEVANRDGMVLSGRIGTAQPLGYRVGPIWHNKIGSALVWPDNTIINLDRDLSTTVSELTNGASFVLQ